MSFYKFLSTCVRIKKIFSVQKTFFSVQKYLVLLFTSGTAAIDSSTAALRNLSPPADEAKAKRIILHLRFGLRQLFKLENLPTAILNSYEIVLIVRIIF